MNNTAMIDLRSVHAEVVGVGLELLGLLGQVGEIDVEVLDLVRSYLARGVRVCGACCAVRCVRSGTSMPPLP